MFNDFPEFTGLIMFKHLPKPFLPGRVIPSDKTPGKWHFTFVSGNIEYAWREEDIDSAAEAKAKMRNFIKQI